MTDHKTILYALSVGDFRGAEDQMEDFPSKDIKARQRAYEELFSHASRQEVISIMKSCIEASTSVVPFLNDESMDPTVTAYALESLLPSTYAAVNRLWRTGYCEDMLPVFYELDALSIRAEEELFARIFVNTSIDPESYMDFLCDGTATENQLLQMTETANNIPQYVSSLDNEAQERVERLVERSVEAYQKCVSATSKPR